MSAQPSDGVHYLTRIPVNITEVCLQAKFVCCKCKKDIPLRCTNWDFKDPKKPVVFELYPHQCEGSKE